MWHVRHVLFLWLCRSIGQETSSDDGDVYIINESSSTAAFAGEEVQVKSQSAIGQICGKRKDGRFDVLWVDGTRSVSNLHDLYLVTDQVLQPGHLTLLVRSSDL